MRRKNQDLEPRRAFDIQTDQQAWEEVNFGAKEFREIAKEVVTCVQGTRQLSVDPVEDVQRILRRRLGHLLPLIGMMEELGELSHSVLKQVQGIRTNENHDANIEDAVGDIQVYGMSFCNRVGLSWHGTLARVWARVRKRSWVANPETGE